MKCIIRNLYTSCCHLEPPPPPPNLQKKKKKMYTQHDVFSPSITRLYYVGEIL